MIFTLLFHVLGAKSFAQSVLFDPNEFHNLTPKQQDEFVISIMELAVEIESRYELEVAKSGFDWNKYRQYTLIIEKINNFLMNSAYAKPQKKKASKPRGKKTNVVSEMAKNFGYLGDQFNQIMEGDKKDNKCLYAGWVSEIVNGKCTHPLNLKGTIANAYKKGDCGKNQISCNPLIFGYKSAQNKTLFCADAGVAHSVNSSVNCMRQALADPPAPGADLKEARLSFLKENTAKYIDNIQKLVFKTCICEPKENPLPNQKINEAYRGKIRLTRTCWGLVNTVKESCLTSDRPIFDKEFAKNLQSIEAELISKDNDAVDEKYTAFLKQFQDQKSNDYAILCDGVTPKCTATCGQKEGGSPSEKIYTCQYQLTLGNKPLEVPASDQKNINKGDKVKINIPNSARTTECVVEEVLDTPLPPVEPVTEAEESISCSVEMKLSEGSNEVNATVIVEPKDRVEKIEWNDIEVPEADKGSSNNDPKFKRSESDAQNTNLVSIPNVYKTIKAKATVTIKNRSTPIECEGSYERPEPKAISPVVEDAPPTIVLKAEPPKNNQVVVKVTSEAPEGWIIVWKGSDFHGNQKTFGQITTVQKDKACAHYEKGDQKTEEQCAEIPALKISTPAQTPMMYPQFFRRDSSTRALGTQ